MANKKVLLVDPSAKRSPCATATKAVGDGCLTKAIDCLELVSKIHEPVG